MPRSGVDRSPRRDSLVTPITLHRPHFEAGTLAGFDAPGCHSLDHPPLNRGRDVRIPLRQFSASLRPSGRFANLAHLRSMRSRPAGPFREILTRARPAKWWRQIEGGLPRLEPNELAVTRAVPDRHVGYLEGVCSVGTCSSPPSPKPLVSSATLAIVDVVRSDGGEHKMLRGRVVSFMSSEDVAAALADVAIAARPIRQA